MKTGAAYWTCQILGWASYAGLGMWMAAQTTGWTVEVIAGYALYFFYSIALTHLLRRYVNRRGWVDTPRYFRLMLAAWITGLVQAALVFAINWAIARNADQTSQYYHKLDTISIAWAKLHNEPDIDHFSLREMCKLFNITNKNPHSALSDARATYELYKRLMELA